MGIIDRFKNAFNAFVNNRDPTSYYIENGNGYYQRPDRFRFTRGNERTIVTSIVNRIALDASSVDIRHVRLDDNNRYISDIDSALNERLTLMANKDQTSREFLRDVFHSMLDEGCVAIVPIDTDVNPLYTDSYKVYSFRTGRVTQWYPDHVKVNIYNDKKGKKEDLILPKRIVALPENPLYAVMNEPSSTMQRLVRKLNILDTIDERSGSDKLDLIVQMPYDIRSEGRRQQAEKRRRDIEDQLAESKYGIAYMSGTEKITQLNRAVENNLLKQIEYLTSMLYGQLGFHQTILDGTADEKTMLNYTNRIVEPIVAAVVDAMKVKFLTKTAITEKQSIMYFRDVFRLAPVNDLAESADKFTRNEIMSKNEFRQIIGMKPSDDPKADQLINSNISQSESAPNPVNNVSKEKEVEGENQNGKV